MRGFRTAFVALAVFVSLQLAPRAQQTLAVSLFERSLDQLRLEAGIPGMSVAVVHNGGIWARGFGMADLERSIPADADTPYPVGDLTVPFTATLVLQLIDRGYLELEDRMERWVPGDQVTVEQVLRHTTTGAFRYEPGRFAAFVPVIEQYMRAPLRKALAREILERLPMRSSVPGQDLAQPSAQDQALFDADDLDRYRAAVARLAVPYRVDLRTRPTRSEYSARALSASGGLISSVRDIAAFDHALEDSPSPMLTDAARDSSQQRGGATVPTGLGWFVQPYNNEILVWHFGNVPDAYSSLILKVPSRNLTLILLANSDGLSAPFPLAQGDVTTSLFARVFLRTFLP